MKKCSKFLNLINISMLFIIIIYNIFFNGLSFRFDYIFITIFILLNLKNTFLWIKKHNWLFAGLLLLYGIYLLVQCILLREGALITNVYNYRYIVLDTLYPILLFVSIVNTNFSDKVKKFIYWGFLALCTICVLYGIINFVFDFNLFEVNSSILNKINGRVQSFYTNPNAYGLFLITYLSFLLFYHQKLKLYEYPLVYLVIISVCLTYSRVFYVLMFAVLGIYCLYSLKVYEKFKKLIPIVFIIVSLISTLFLPNNNYLYISAVDKFDAIFHTNITQIFLDKKEDTKDTGVNNSIIDIDDLPTKNSNTDVLDKITEVNNRDTSSAGTRKTYQEVAWYFYNNNKWLGVGGLNYYILQEEYLAEKGMTYLIAGLPHNNFLLFLARDGIIGLGVILLLLVDILIIIIQKTKENHNRLILPLIIFSLFMISNLFGDLMVRFDRANIVYIFLGLSIILNNKKERSEVK